jgi:hypothetical protein
MRLMSIKWVAGSSSNGEQKSSGLRPRRFVLDIYFAACDRAA